MRKIFLLSILFSITINSFSSRDDTIQMFNIFAVKDIAVLNKTFKTKFIRTVSIYEFNSKSFNYLVNTLRKNKTKFHNFKITSDRLGSKYKKLLEFNIRKLTVNSISVGQVVVYPKWISDFKISKMELILSEGDDISRINFAEMIDLTSLKVKGVSMEEKVINRFSKIKYLDEFFLDLDSTYNYKNLLDSLSYIKTLGINLNQTSLVNLQHHNCLQFLTVYDAKFSFITQIDKLCFIKNLKINTSLDVNQVKEFIKIQKCNPFISFFQNGYSINKWVAKRKMPKPKRKYVKPKRKSRR